MKHISLIVSFALAVTLAHGQETEPDQTSGTAQNPPTASSGNCPSSKVWSVTPWGHFERFTTSVFDWKTLVSPAVTVGFSRLLGVGDDGFPRTRSGYARHYRDDVLGNVDGKFFGNFALPLLFRQDEQFQRRGGTDRGLWDRVTHVLEHAGWAGQGLTPVNVSSLGGNALNAILANTYMPQSQRTVGATARRFGLGMAIYVGGDMYTEFSPDIWSALKKLLGVNTRPHKPDPNKVLSAMAYSQISPDQQHLVSSTVWNGWDPSQQLEFLGGTSALVTWCLLTPDCNSANEPGLEKVMTVTKVNGAGAKAKPEDQYNIWVTWQAAADKCFDNARGWGVHMAQLHPGFYGYDQNEANDALLGLVVLFQKSDSKQGQFHIGFGDLPDHFSADENSNIAENYDDYCRWYGSIGPYKQCAAVALAAAPPPPPPPPISPQPLRAGVAAESVPSRAASVEEQAQLQSTVQAFLTAWYVQADYARLDQFVAQDNFYHRGAGNANSSWQIYFKAAFKLPAKPVKDLNDAISYHEMTLPNGSEKLRYLNPNSARKPLGPFAIIDPTSLPRGAYFPPADLPADELRRWAARAQYFDHLRRSYPGRLYLVVYATKSPNLVREGVVLYWILEGSDWKLAAFQTTD